MTKNSGKRLSKREFNKLFNDPDTPRKATTGQADWDEIYKALQLVNDSIDIATIQKEYVKGAVKRFRTKNKLQEWATQGKCKMIWHQGRYLFLFPKPKKPRAPKKQ